MEDIRGFEVCGPDRVFHPADVEVDRRELLLVVSSKEVASPVAVRYGFRDFMPGNLANIRGLPVVPFRTDDFECRDTVTGNPPGGGFPVYLAGISFSTTSTHSGWRRIYWAMKGHWGIICSFLARRSSSTSCTSSAPMPCPSYFQGLRCVSG